MKEPTWEEAVKAVLSEADGALHYTEIAERILAKGLRKNPGATPAQTVASLLSISLVRGNSPFQRVAPGQYIIRQGTAQPAAQQAEAEAAAEEAATSEAGALQAFGTGIG